MKHALLCVLLCISLAAIAQQPDQEAPAKNEDQATVPSGQPEEDQSPDESEQTEPSDKDFRPSEEISEDYPVPLPSDI